MSRFDDDLREALRSRADRVVPPADPLEGIARRARRIRRRRVTAAVAGAAVAATVVGVAAPVAIRHLGEGGPDDLQMADRLEESTSDKPPEPSATAAPEALAEGNGDDSTSAPPSRESDASQPMPANHLAWPPRGEQPPKELVLAGREWFAKRRGLPPDAVVVQRLWGGTLPADAGDPADREWVFAFQAWPRGADPARAAASTVVARAGPNGNAPEVVHSMPTRFQHPPPDEDASEAVDDVRRIKLISIPLDRTWVLALGAPEVERIEYAGDGGSFTPVRTVDGIALFKRDAEELAGTPLDLVVARDRAGRVLTPADRTARRLAETLGLPTPDGGWGLDDQIPG